MQKTVLSRLQRDIHSWRNWVQAAKPRLARSKDTVSLAWMRVYGPSMRLLLDAFYCHRLLSRNEHATIAGAFDNWEETPLFVRLGVLSFVNKIHGRVLDREVDCAVAVLRDFARALAFAGTPLEVPGAASVTHGRA